VQRGSEGYISSFGIVLMSSACLCLHGTGSLYSRLLYIQEGNALKGTCKDLTARGWETKGKYSEKNIILYGGSRSTIFKK
jgi:hypothetical protein